MLKSFIHKAQNQVKKLDPRKDKRPFVFMICLVIATVLWFVTELGKDYSTTVTVPIKYINLPKNKVLVESPPDRLQLNVKALGSTLIWYKLKSAFDPIKFNVGSFTNNQMSHGNGRKYKLISNRYIRQISRQLSKDISIQSVLPDTLIFVFDQIIEQKKIVKPVFNLSFTNQYFLFDTITLTPDSVLVRGPKSIIDTLKHVFTKQQKFKNLDASIRRNISLENIQNLEIEPRRIIVDIPVSQYSEYVNEIPITCIGMPDSIRVVTFPGTIKVSCLAAINEHKNISESSFLLGFKYDDVKANTDNIAISVFGTPELIKNLKFHPKEVEFIIEKKHD